MINKFKKIFLGGLLATASIGAITGVAVSLTTNSNSKLLYQEMGIHYLLKLKKFKQTLNKQHILQLLIKTTKKKVQFIL